MKHRVQGSVTVFLALTFVLILSLVLAVLESARAAALRVYAKLALATAMESVSADFYRPLFDEYGLYGMNTGMGGRYADIAGITGAAKQYLNTNLEYGELEELSIECTQVLTGGSGNVFCKQASEAARATIAEYAVTELLNRVGALTNQSETLRVLERKSEVESKLALIDTETLNLMRLIDGVDINKQALLGSGRVYSIKNQFVKAFMIYEPNQVNVAVNNSSVFAELAPFYRNPLDMAERLKDEILEFKELAIERDNLSEQLKQSEAVQNSDDTSEASEEETTETDEIREAMSICVSRIKEQVDLCNHLLVNLSTLTDNTFSLMEEAVGQISDVKVLCNRLIPSVLEYEDVILSFADSSDEGLMGSLLSSLDEMKAYVGLTDYDATVDFARMKTTLENNLDILSDCGELDEIAFSTLDSPERLERYAGIITSFERTISGFSYDGLCFDYSGITAEYVQDGVIDAVRSEINGSFAEGILKFVLPEGFSLSDSELDTSLFPDIPADSPVKEDVEGTGAEALPEDNGNGELLGEEISLKDIISQSPITGLTGLMADMAGKAYYRMMLILYLDDRFTNFAERGTAQGRVLEYEQEFIAAGRESDKENLASIALQIALIRMIPSAIYTYTDKNTTSQAKSVVNATVGMLGMPFLTAVATALVLLVWAVEQAVVETAAVLAGYKVPPYTADNTFCIGFAELVMFSADFVRDKAQTFKDTSWGLVYGDYIKLLLLIKSEATIAERTLGLIQENLRYAYDEDFRICNCVTSMKGTASIYADPVYVSLFSHLFAGHEPDRYTVCVQTSVSY